MKGLNKIYNVSRFSPSQNLQDYSLQQRLKIIILTGQFFALLPVDGVTKDAQYLVFNWASMKTIYSIFTIILETIYTAVVLASFNINGENFFSFEVIVWNVRAFLGLLLFLNLGRKWPQLLRQWTDVEKSMLDYGPIPSLKPRFRIISATFAAINISEHLLFVSGGTTKVLSRMKEGESFFKNYFETIYEDFFNATEYTHWKAIYVEFLTLITTFERLFCDLFIVLLSSALAERLRQIAIRIGSKQILNESQWRDVRKHYNKLSLLCKTLNNAVSEVVVLSFFGNVYFLSVGIFQCFTPRTAFEAFYFWYGIVVLLFHFITVCLYASWVHEESTKSLSEVLSVPVKNTSYEYERLVHQMAEGNIAIYGGGLFKITKSTILQVTSVILTLQLIFFQFKTQIPSNIA